MTDLAQFGVSASDLAGGHEQTVYPETVPGRVAHLDADFMAYQVSAESKAELDPDDPTPRKSYEDMQHNAKEAALHLMRLAGAESYVCHVTPNGSDKGGRDSQAIQKEYQANRKARKERPEYLDAMREFIGSPEMNGVRHMLQEADDGMAQAAYNAEDPNLVVVVSADKDLRMVPGLHLMPDTGKLVRLKDRFGYIEIDDTKSSKKLVGFGTKFFWAQVLMGDTADNIQGLPKLPGHYVQLNKPSAAFNKALANFDNEYTGAKRPEVLDRLNKKMQSLKKPKPCGPVLTYELLKDVKSDTEAFNRVRSFWVRLEEDGHEFKHWLTDEPVSATKALLSDMQLLWMRRNSNPNDVLEWLKEQRNA